MPHAPVTARPLRSVSPAVLWHRLTHLDWRSERGQATTEYALVLLAAALVGVLVIGWATAGGGAAAIGRLFDSAIESVIDQL
ncbi:MAG: hypothetical protein ACLGHQ_11875 [Acidimicrobiia bacterium]